MGVSWEDPFFGYLYASQKNVGFANSYPLISRLLVKPPHILGGGDTWVSLNILSVKEILRVIFHIKLP